MPNLFFFFFAVSRNEKINQNESANEMRRFELDDRLGSRIVRHRKEGGKGWLELRKAKHLKAEESIIESIVKVIGFDTCRKRSWNAD